MLQLLYSPGKANLAPHILLEELGVPFELQRIATEGGQHRSAEYLKLNPNGLIPVLLDGELVLYETAAICLHLADTHPQARLAPPLGSGERAQFYKWLSWMSTTLQPMLITYYYPERWVDPGNAEGTAQVKRQAEARIAPMLDQLEAQLASHGGPWLLGEHYSACDPYAFMLGRWTRGFARPARCLPKLGAYLQRLLDRPALQRAIASEQLSQPLV